MNFSLIKMSGAEEQQVSLSYKIRGLKDKEPFNIDSEGLETVGDLMTKIITTKDLEFSIKLIYTGKVLSPEIKLSDVSYKPDGFFVFIEDKKKVMKEEVKEEIVEETAQQPVNIEQPVNHQLPNEGSLFQELPTSNEGSLFQESPTSNEANRDGIYANIFVNLIKMAEDSNKMAEHLNDINLLKTMMKDVKISHTLMALSPELRKKMVESNPQIKQIINQYPNEYKEVIEDPELLQKGQVAFNKTLQLLQQQMGMGGMGMDMMNSGGEESIYENQMNTGMNEDSSLGSTLGLNDEDMKEVNEITNITGRSKQEVMQVYVVCEKNKELAINMIFN